LAPFHQLVAEKIAVLRSRNERSKMAAGLETLANAKELHGMRRQLMGKLGPRPPRLFSFERPPPPRRPGKNLYDEYAKYREAIEQRKLVDRLRGEQRKRVFALVKLHEEAARIELTEVGQPLSKAILVLRAITQIYGRALPGPTSSIAKMIGRDAARKVSGIELSRGEMDTLIRERSGTRSSRPRAVRRREV
jgi:hypothetical protein